MAYDEALAQRLRQQFRTHTDVAEKNVTEKKMFGGLCFMLSNHMCCGIVGDTLMLRVGPDNYEQCLRQKYVREMDFTGKAMKGMVYVDAKGLATDRDLARWVGIASDFVASLPPKQPKKLSQKKNVNKPQRRKAAGKSAPRAR